MFKRLSNLIRGFFGLFVSGLEKKNPEALLELEKENLRKQIAEYNQGLSAHAALSERLMTQVKKLDDEEGELKAKATAHLRAGNREQAAQYALRLQAAKQQLTENRSQLEQAEETYKRLIGARDIAVSAARKKIQALAHSIQDMKIQTATAELSEMASGMVTEIGGSGDTLDRLHGMVEEERERAAGRARVARDSIDTADFDLEEVEQAALAEQALADFAAEAGIDLEPVVTEGGSALSDDEPLSGQAGEAREAPAKSMGPQAEGE